MIVARRRNCEAQASFSRTLICVVTPSRLTDLSWVALGGAFGSLARYLVSLWIGAPDVTGGFPVATLAVNLLGAGVLGALAEVATRCGGARWRRARLIFGTGVLGGFTTYSLLADDLATALVDGYVALALSYAAATLLGGVLMTWSGIVIGRRIAVSLIPSASAGPHQTAGPHTGDEQ